MAFGSGSGSASSKDHYEAEVNKKDLNMSAFTTTLNRRWRDGWRLDHAFEQGGNTVVVWARRDDERPIVVQVEAPPATAPAPAVVAAAPSPPPPPPPALTLMPPGTEAGWQPDPTGEHQHRWWDGNGWTDHTA